MSETVQVKIQKWGNGLALRVSGLMREIPKLEDGTAVEVEIFADGFTVRKSKPKVKLYFPFTEKDLLKSINPATAHLDALATLSAKDFAHE